MKLLHIVAALALPATLLAAGVEVRQVDTGQIPENPAKMLEIVGTAENTNANISQRRSRTIECAVAATVSRTAINALNAGWPTHRPVNGSPGTECSAVNVKNTP